MFDRLFSWFKKRRPAPVARPEAAPGSGRPAPAGFRRQLPKVKGSQPWAAGAAKLGIDPALPPHEIRARLAALYRRYNRAAANLNAEVRQEAEEMLDAIIDVRKALRK